MGDSCCKDCPDRKVYPELGKSCRSFCAKWQAEYKDKEAEYERRKIENDKRDAEFRYREQVNRRIKNHRRTTK